MSDRGVPSGGRKYKIPGTNVWGRTFRSAPKTSAKPKAKTTKPQSAPKKASKSSGVGSSLRPPKKASKAPSTASPHAPKYSKPTKSPHAGPTPPAKMTKGPSMSGGPAIGFRGKAPTKSTPVKTGNRNGYATRPSGSSATSGVPKTDPHSTRSRASSIGKRGPAASKGTSTQPKLKKEGSVFKFAKKVSKKVRGFSDRMDNNVRDPLRAKMGLPKAGGAKKSKPNTRRSKQRGGKR